MENKKIKNVREADLAISEFIEQMVKSGYRVRFNKFQAVDNLSFELKLANRFHNNIAYIKCDDKNDLYLSVCDDMWALDEIPDLSFAITSCISFVRELEKLLEYDEH